MGFPGLLQGDLWPLGKGQWAPDAEHSVFIFYFFLFLLLRRAMEMWPWESWSSSGVGVLLGKVPGWCDLWPRVSTRARLERQEAVNPGPRVPGVRGMLGCNCREETNPHFACLLAGSLKPGGDKNVKVPARKRRSKAMLYPAGVGDPCEDPKPQVLQELPLVLALRPCWLPGRSGRWKVAQGLRVQGCSARWLDSAVPLYIGTRTEGAEAV